MAIRLGLSVMAGALVTLALFYLMQALIQGADSAFTEDKIGNLVDFVRIKQDQDLETKNRKPKKPPPPDKPPPEIPPKDFNVKVDKSSFTMTPPSLAGSPDIGPGGFTIDGEYLPIVKVEPQYPRRALTRGMSGWVLLEFTVTEQGTVIDPVIIENCGWIKNARNEGECFDSPNNVFDSSARKAAVKFKYKPRVINGNPMATAGVQNLITYELVDD